MDMIQAEPQPLDAAWKRIGRRILIWSVLILGAAILCVGLPYAVLRG